VATFAELIENLTTGNIPNRRAIVERWAARHSRGFPKRADYQHVYGLSGEVLNAAQELRFRIEAQLEKPPSYALEPDVLDGLSGDTHERLRTPPRKATTADLRRLRRFSEGLRVDVEQLGDEVAKLQEVLASEEAKTSAA
jgi:hypothetical protein